MTFYEKKEMMLLVLNKARLFVGDGIQVGVGCIGMNENNEIIRPDLFFHYPSYSSDLGKVMRNISIGKFYHLCGEAISFFDIPRDNLTFFYPCYTEIDHNELDTQYLMKLIKIVDEEELFFECNTESDDFEIRYKKDQVFWKYVDHEKYNYHHFLSKA